MEDDHPETKRRQNVLSGGNNMIKKQPLVPERVRKIQGSFAFIEHRFLRCGFWENLTHHELLLYLFLIMAADRQGLSYYRDDNICRMTGIPVEEYIPARDSLIKKKLIAFDGFLFQVLSLPGKPVTQTARRPAAGHDREGKDPSAVYNLISNCLSAQKSRQI